jgi:hypothetical protein
MKLLRNLGFMLIGIFFGIVLIKAEVVSWWRIQEMFHFQSFHMYGIIGSAVIVGALSVILLKALKAKSSTGEVIDPQGKPFNKVGELLRWNHLWSRLGPDWCLPRPPLRPLRGRSLVHWHHYYWSTPGDLCLRPPETQTASLELLGPSPAGPSRLRVKNTAGDRASSGLRYRSGYPEPAQDDPASGRPPDPLAVFRSKRVRGYPA